MEGQQDISIAHMILLYRTQFKVARFMLQCSMATFVYGQRGVEFCKRTFEQLKTEDDLKLSL
jgi:hypothetical protein